MEPEFQPYGLPHLTVIFLTVVLPFALAAIVWCTRSQRVERMIISVLSTVLILNYVAYLVFIRSRGVVDWRQMLPMQMCDWGMVVVIVAMWTGSQRWFEVAYFWGIGGTLQAVLTPNLRFGFPDWRFISFFTSHCGIIIGVVFLMLTRRFGFASAVPSANARSRTAFFSWVVCTICHCRSGNTEITEERRKAGGNPLKFLRSCFA